jgi:adenylate kinase family enzyme
MTEFFGAILIGPSGSGKSTMCAGIQQFFSSIKRKHITINLDPANEDMKYKVKKSAKLILMLV